MCVHHCFWLFNLIWWLNTQLWKCGSLWSAWRPTLLCHPNPCPDSDPGIRKSQLHESRAKGTLKIILPNPFIYRSVIWAWQVKWLHKMTELSRIQGSWPLSWALLWLLPCPPFPLAGTSRVREGDYRGAITATYALESCLWRNGVMYSLI